MSDPEPRHGFNDDDETRQRLRSPPTGEALAWVRVVTGELVSGWSVLRGGMSSAMYAIELEGSTPRSHR